jgi:hypothetical protein
MYVCNKKYEKKELPTHSSSPKNYKKLCGIKGTKQPAGYRYGCCSTLYFLFGGAAAMKLCNVRYLGD